MRYLVVFVGLLCAVTFVSSAYAGAIADSVAFQGRLTDASDSPVPDGTRDLILSIWTDSVGGTMLHSEVVVVTTSKGLYSTCIGCGNSSFPGIFSGQTLFLETQLAGQPAMTPRQRLRSVPFSLSSSSLHGQSLVPGGGIVSAAVSSVSGLGGGGGGAAAASYARLSADSDGDGHDDFFVADSALTNGVHQVTGGDLDGDGSPDLAADLEVRVDRIEMKLYDDSDALQRSSVSQGASTDSANQMISTDLDGDGIPDVVVSSSARAAGASLAINTKGTGAKRLRAGGDCDDTDSEIYADCDDDDDGIADRAASLRITPTTSSLAINSKGTSAKRLSGGRDCDDESVRDYLDCDDDGDGLAESSVVTTADSDGSSFSMKSTNGGMPNRISMNVTVPKQSQRCTIAQGSDSDLDGIDETSMTSTVERKSGSIIYLDREGNEVLRSMVGVDSTKGVVSTDADSDGDGVPDSEAFMKITPGTSAVAIKVKGTGADKNRSAGGSCDDSSAVDYLDIDDDGDGISEAKFVNTVKSSPPGGGAASASYAATGRWYTDSDDDGVPEGDIECIVTPTTNSVAIKTKGTGADKNRVISSTTDTSRAVTIHSADIDGDGVADYSIREQCDDSDAGITVARSGGEIKIRHKGWDGTIKGRMAIETGGAIEVDFGGDGVGFVSQRFGIGVLSPSNPLEHSSGAHLTAGGVWTNASDENLKENFQTVDGEELLEKIEQLPISEWNYKTESDEVKHIGPTAQDFQETFGVGSDGKSISTIDPSGIALAAIKELSKQNRELKEQNTAMQKQLEELIKKIEQLSAK